MNKRLMFKIFGGTILGICIIALISSCGTDANGLDESERFTDGILNEIFELIDEDKIGIIEEELEMPIHRGSTPPNLQAVFAGETESDEVTVVISPNLLHYSTVPTDQGRFSRGTRFNDSYFRFSNQDLDNFTINVDRVSSTLQNPYFGSGSYIIGENGSFTVFGLQENRRSEGVVINISIFSGTIADGGIEDAWSVFFMIDDSDISTVIPAGTGRSFSDGEGFASLTDWPTELNSTKGSQDLFNERGDFDELIRE